MDKIVNKIAGVGVPGLMLMVAISMTGLGGAAAITAALAILGPGGMIGGIMTLLASGMLASAIAEYGFDAIFTAVVKKMVQKGQSKAEIIKKIEKGPWSSKLKAKAVAEVRRV